MMQDGRARFFTLVWMMAMLGCSLFRSFGSGRLVRFHPRDDLWWRTLASDLEGQVDDGGGGGGVLVRVNVGFDGYFCWFDRGLFIGRLVQGRQWL
ncbi:hypothetical protein EDD21DRAFT_385831 [Dissophora ornata]|nr:hypothetical protein EDD21DRAFT_385831 [Dissophora ornata]